MDLALEKEAHVFYHEPNELTKAAFDEAKAGKLEGPIDTSSVEAMLKSIGLLRTDI